MNTNNAYNHFQLQITMASSVYILPVGCRLELLHARPENLGVWELFWSKPLVSTPTKQRRVAFKHPQRSFAASWLWQRAGFKSVDLFGWK